MADLRDHQATTQFQTLTHPAAYSLASLVPNISTSRQILDIPAPPPWVHAPAATVVKCCMFCRVVFIASYLWLYAVCSIRRALIQICCDNYRVLLSTLQRLSMTCSTSSASSVCIYLSVSSVCLCVCVYVPHNDQLGRTDFPHNALSPQCIICTYVCACVCVAY